MCISEFKTATPFQTTSAITTTASDPFDVTRYADLAILQTYDVNTPAAVEFVAGVSEVQTLTFPALAAATAGDYFVVYDSAGLAWAVWLDVTGSDTAPTGAIYTAIPAARKARCDISGCTDAASVAAAVELVFDALTAVTITTDDTPADGTMTFTTTVRGNCTAPAFKNADDSGAGSITGTTSTAGVTSTVDIDANTASIASHGLVTGLKGQLTTSAGSLPGGLSTSTDYFVIVVDASTIKFATTLANALAGTAVNITNQGTAASTFTFTPTSLAGCTLTLSGSVDGETYITIGSATSITADGSAMSTLTSLPYKYLKWTQAITAGSCSVTVKVSGKAYQF